MSEKQLTEEDVKQWEKARAEHTAELKKALPHLRVEEEYWRLRASIEANRFNIARVQFEKANYEQNIKDAKGEGESENIDKMPSDEPVDGEKK